MFLRIWNSRTVEFLHSLECRHVSKVKANETAEAWANAEC